MEKSRGLGLPAETMTPHQAERLAFMKAIVQAVLDTPMVLKGGTALLLAHGLDRYSEDLDFDSTAPINLDAKLKRAAVKAGVAIVDVRQKKNTETTKRYMVDFTGKHGSSSIKIETSLRSDSIDQSNVLTVDGMRVYNAATIIGHKLGCTESRSKVRDLYDLDYLARTHANDFTKDQAKALATFTANPDSIYSRYAADHQGDPLLASKPLDELALSISVRAAELATALSADVHANPIESQYSGAFESTLEAKQRQADRLADKLESLIEKQQGTMKATQEKAPGLLARPATRTTWEKQTKQQTQRLDSLRSRLDGVREIAHGMGVHGPKIEELVHRQVRNKEPELAKSWDKYREDQRREVALQRKSDNSQTKGLSEANGRKLNRDR